MQLPTLYKTSSKGATQVLNMEIIGDTYTRTWGQVMGKMQSKSTTAKPKNIGRSNETTAAEQAIIEAKAVWAKKQKSGYSTSEEAPTTVNLPMKVNNYHKHKKKIIFPCYTSVKLNGVNAEYRLNGENLQLLSRGGEEYTIPPHQRSSVINLMHYLDTTSLNGEMYIHGEFLQDITAATKKHNDLTHKLVFHIFDFPEINGDYRTRCEYAYGKVANGTFLMEGITMINVGMATSHDELDAQHSQAVAAGYEGIIIRNSKGLYKYNTRSLDVFKYKLAQDAEFEVRSYGIDKNGHVVFTCWATSNHTGDKSTFKVKLRGTNEERLEMAANAADYIGKWLKVEYEMLSKDGVPQKPVGIMFRKVDANGEANE